MRDDAAKDQELVRHAEKLALAFALVASEQDCLIVLNNTLRTCLDCHAFFKTVSALEDRKIVLSDVKRVHVFERGSCSCNDFY